MSLLAVLLAALTTCRSESAGRPVEQTGSSAVDASSTTVETPTTSTTAAPTEAIAGVEPGVRC